MTTEYRDITTKKEYHQLKTHILGLLIRLVFKKDIETIEIHRSKIKDTHIRIITK